MIHPHAPLRPLLAILGLAFLAACTETPTATSELDGLSFAKGGKPGGNTNDCGFTALSISIGSGALGSDGAGPYKENIDNVGAHLNGATGNLKLHTSQYGPTNRFVNVTTSAGTVSTKDRIFTNNHDNPGGDDACGFKGMVAPTGSAVLEVELNLDDSDPYDVVRWGKDCDGDPLPDNRVDTAFDGVGTWTIMGGSGVHCKQLGKKPALTPVGTAGPVDMTLVEDTGP